MINYLLGGLEETNNLKMSSKLDIPVILSLSKYRKAGTFVNQDRYGNNKKTESFSNQSSHNLLCVH
jgi:hypothetical protein